MQLVAEKYMNWLLKILIVMYELVAEKCMQLVAEKYMNWKFYLYELVAENICIDCLKMLIVMYELVAKLGCVIDQISWNK
jgi:hypothetical protein